MSYHTINLTKFIIVFIMMFIGTIFVTVGFASYVYPEYNLFVLVIIMLPLLLLAAKLAQIITKIPNGLTILNDKLQINEREIGYDLIDQYYFNDTAIGSITLELKLKSGRSEQAMMSTRAGKEAKNHFQKVFKNYLEGIEKEMEESNYMEIHSSQIKYVRPILIALLIVVLGLDLLFIYSLITDNAEVPYQLLFVNLLGLGMFPYLKRKK